MLPGVLATLWWSLLWLLHWLEAGECAACVAQRTRGLIGKGAEGLHGIGIIGCTPVVGNGRGVHGERFMCGWGSPVLVGIGPWGEQLGPQGLALLLLRVEATRTR